MVLATDWTAIGTLTLAGVATFTLIAAVFQEPIRRHFNRATLSMHIGLDPPDTTWIGATDAFGQSLGKILYMRIRVDHNGGTAGDNAEIIVTSLWRRSPTAATGYEVVPTFLPLGLLWSHIRTATIRVPVGVFRHCDLGHFMQVRASDGSTAVFFVFDLIVQPNVVQGDVYPGVLEPGDYKFELTLTGDNVRKVVQRWTLSFEGPWSDDMLDRIDLAPA